MDRKNISKKKFEHFFQKPHLQMIIFIDEYNKKVTKVETGIVETGMNFSGRDQVDHSL